MSSCRGSCQLPMQRPIYGTGACSPPRCHFGRGVALGCSLPDSIMVGRTGPIGSRFDPRGEDAREARFCSMCASLFTGVVVGEAAGLGAAAASERDLPVLVGCGTDRSLRPSPASAPDARICSSVGAADFFSRDLGLVRAGVADSGGVCSDSEEGVACVGASDFFSLGTTTSCACICPTSTRQQSSSLKNPLSIKRPINRSRFVTSVGSRHGLAPQSQPLTSILSPFARGEAEEATHKSAQTCLAGWARDLNHRQRKAKAQFILQINFHVMHPVLLKLHAAEIMHVRCVALHLLQHKLDLRLRNDLLLIHADNSRFLSELS